MNSRLSESISTVALVLGEDEVVVGRRFLHELVFVLEARAAAAGHDDAQHRAVGLLGQHRPIFCAARSVRMTSFGC